MGVFILGGTMYSASNFFYIIFLSLISFNPSRIMPPSSEHVVVTMQHTIGVGEHYFHPSALPSHLASFALSFFSGEFVTNADHPEFLSVMQSFSAWWAECLSDPESSQSSPG